MQSKFEGTETSWNKTSAFQRPVINHLTIYCLYTQINEVTNTEEGKYRCVGYHTYENKEESGENYTYVRIRKYYSPRVCNLAAKSREQKLRILLCQN